MKKLILILGTAAAVVLAGCNKGGTSDQYGTSSGTATSSNSPSAGHSSTTTNSTP
jgi:hypothetical protein